MKTERYLSIEQPDKVVLIDFLGTNSRKKKDRRACSVRIEVEDGFLRVLVKGADDRVTILLDESIELPEEDRRR